MPFVKMKCDAEGSQDGITIKLFKKGQEYNLNLNLANNFVKDQRVATFVAQKIKIDKEIKMMKVPENKMANVPENKENLDEGLSLTVFQLSDEMKIPSKKIVKAAKKIGYDVEITSVLNGIQIQQIKDFF